MLDARNVALVLEGGGMRNSYTAACIDQLLAHGVKFGWVGGVSAGASHTVNFLSGDRLRARESFITLPAHPAAGGMSSFIRGNGYFNSDFIYEQAALPNASIPFNFETFFADDTPFSISALRADTGETVSWGRGDQKDDADLMRQVRASSTIPALMPTAFVDGVPYVDGALGDTGGLVLPNAIEAGFDKFLILATKPRNYTRPAMNSPQLVRLFNRKYPAVAEAALTRHERYNEVREQMTELERQGKAMIFYPENMMVTSTERKVRALRRNYALGMQQTMRELPRWLEFLRD